MTAILVNIFMPKEPTNQRLDIDNGCLGCCSVEMKDSPSNNVLSGKCLPMFDYTRQIILSVDDFNKAIDNENTDFEALLL